MIIGYKEIEYLVNVLTFRNLHEFKGSYVEIFPEDTVFSCQVDNIGVPYFVWLPNAGKDVTIVFMEMKPNE